MGPSAGHCDFAIRARCGHTAATNRADRTDTPALRINRGRRSRSVRNDKDLLRSVAANLPVSVPRRPVAVGPPSISLPIRDRSAKVDRHAGRSKSASLVIASPRGSGISSGRMKRRGIRYHRPGMAPGTFRGALRAGQCFDQEAGTSRWRPDVLAIML
jgi:hypothetical protein